VANGQFVKAASTSDSLIQVTCRLQSTDDAHM
jgi:hypothetical protein